MRERTSPRRATRSAVNCGETRNHIFIPPVATDGSRDPVVLWESWRRRGVRRKRMGLAPKANYVGHATLQNLCPSACMSWYWLCTELHVGGMKVVSC